MLQQTHYTQKNGLESFADCSPDYVLAPVGIGSLKEQAEHLAEYGRHGDIYVVHAAEGETVVPMEVLDANPKIRELLFDQMRGMGIEPERYIVGNELNSLNPDTGMPEFFIKSIFKGIKKLVKKVVKVVKKVAPIVLPIAASMFGIPFLGPAFGAGTFGASFLGSGIGTLVGGGSLKDALKAGLMSGGMAAIGGGLKGAFSPSGSFLGGLEGSFTGSTPVFNELGKQIGTQVAASPLADSSIFGGGSSATNVAGAARSSAQFDALGKGDLVEGLGGSILGKEGLGTPGFVADPGANLSAVPFNTGAPGATPGSVTGDFSGFAAPDPGAAPGAAPDLVTPPELLDETLLDSPATWQDVSGTVIPTAPGPVEPRTSNTDFVENVFGKDVDETVTKAGDYLFRGGRSEQQIAQAAADASDEAMRVKRLALAKQGITGPEASKAIIAAGDAAAEAVKPGILAKYGPTAATMGLGAVAFGAFEPQKQEDDESAEDLEKRIAEFNNRYGTNYDWKDYKVELRPTGHRSPSGPQYTPTPVGFFGETAFAANGGPVFLANGGPVSSPPRFGAPTTGARFGVPYEEEPVPFATASDYVSSYRPLPARTPFRPTNYTTQPKSIGTGFDAAYYYQQHEDVRDDDHYGAHHKDPQKAWQHYQSHGKGEKRAHRFLGDTEKERKGKPINQEGINFRYNPNDYRISLFAQGDYDPDYVPAAPAAPVSAPVAAPAAAPVTPPVAAPAPPPPAPPQDDYDGDYESTVVARSGGFIDQMQRPEMYGQRARALVEGPGTEKSDSIPARLSNGEFVLTARAVRGADPTGQGNRYRGAQNLYKLMRNFEMRA